jgi:hypothetical protein
VGRTISRTFANKINSLVDCDTPLSKRVSCVVWIRHLLAKPTPMDRQKMKGKVRSLFCQHSTLPWSIVFIDLSRTP